MAGAALGIARHFDQDDFRVGGLDRFISGHQVRTRSRTSADHADRAILGVESNELVNHRVQVGDHDALCVAHAGADEFGELDQVRGDAGQTRGNLYFRLSHGRSRIAVAHALHHFMHNFGDQFFFHRSIPPDRYHVRVIRCAIGSAMPAPTPLQSPAG